MKVSYIILFLSVSFLFACSPQGNNEEGNNSAVKQPMNDSITPIQSKDNQKKVEDITIEDILENLRQINFLQIPFPGGEVVMNREVKDQWLIKNVGRVKKTNSFDKIKQMQVVRVQDSIPIIHEGNQMFPVIEIEEWVFSNRSEASECLLELKELTKSPDFKKPPQSFILIGNRIYYLITMAEAFRAKMNIVENQIEKSY